jgi:NOL1/NOP2/fmu family ribosome biogenesis protein
MNQRRKNTQNWQQVDVLEAAQVWIERFGITPEAFDQYQFWRSGTKTYWIAHRELEVPASIHPQSIGMAFVRKRGAFPKPTSNAIFRFGHLARQNVIELGPAQALDFLRRERFAMPQPEGVTRGFVVARHQGIQLGCGLWIEGFLSSQIATSRSLDDNAPLYGLTPEG